MTTLPEPPAPMAGQTIPTAVDREQAARWLAALDELAVEQPTAVRVEDASIPSFEDGSRIGTTPPVQQPDSRIVPAWAAGIAVASIGVGAGATGIGCAVWLAMKGFSMATLNGVLMVAAPFAGVAVIALATGTLLRSLSGIRTETHHHYNAPVDQRNQESKTTGVWAKNTNQQ